MSIPAGLPSSEPSVRHSDQGTERCCTLSTTSSRTDQEIYRFVRVTKRAPPLVMILYRGILPCFQRGAKCDMSSSLNASGAFFTSAHVSGDNVTRNDCPSSRLRVERMSQHCFQSSVPSSRLRPPLSSRVSAAEMISMLKGSRINNVALREWYGVTIDPSPVIVGKESCRIVNRW